MSLSLKIEQLVVDRGGVPVIHGLSCAISEPGWIGIIGANGSGKTSLLRALAGRLPVRSGRILLDGVDATSDRARLAASIGFAVEGSFLPADLTPLEIYAIAGRERDAWRRQALDGLRVALGIEPLLGRKCATLSAGMAQRVAIFAAFLDLSPIVILDEPFNWLDPVSAYDTKQALRGLVQELDLTLITALHDVSTLTSYCDRALLMSAGRIALALDVADLAAGRGDAAAFEARLVDRLREV